MRFAYSWGGDADPAFWPVRDAFLSNFAAGRECDAQCCVYARGRCVVDVWASAAGSRNAGYNGDSLQIVCSSTKSLSALAVASLVDRGLIRYGDGVVDAWPEFGKYRKEGVTVADVLRHESGMANPRGSFRFVGAASRSCKIQVEKFASFRPEALLRENIRRNEVGKMLEQEFQAFPPDSFGSRREYHPFSR